MTAGMERKDDEDKNTNPEKIFTFQRITIGLFAKTFPPGHNFAIFEEIG